MNNRTPDKAAPSDVLYDSKRTRVLRVHPADGSAGVIRKQPLGPDADDRLSHELSVLRRLAGVAGTPRLAADTAEGTISFVATEARPLSALPSPWSAGPLLDLAYELAVTLARIHRNGVVHRDVSPANILVPMVDGMPAPDQTPTLIDFELSTTAEQRLVSVTEEGLAGTLPYLAPEQTGRTGRPVDHRADLYALGATLYELQTGAPPFGRDADPLTLVHDHLARLPVPVTDVNPAMPRLLSDITLRLLAKEPEQRYQSGEGLAYDLARLRDARRHGTEAGFPLGERDFPLRLAPTTRLVGRDASLATLSRLFAEAVAGNRGVLLVSGPPGVGKTALIDRLRPAVAAAGGRFITGKFDQFRRDLGADGLGQAFLALGAQLLAEPDEEVGRLRERLLAELGSNAGLTAAVLPPFAVLLGVDPEEDVDDPRTTAARLRQIRVSLLRTLASAARPVVLFVDDLQWAGPGAFGFLDAVLDEPGLSGVLVLGAFREAEVDEAHPLTGILARLRRTGGELRLDNLSPAHLGTLLAEMLRLPLAEAVPLAEALAVRTGGNPFDTVELVNALRREGALVPEGDRWSWDAVTLRRFVGRGDVIDLLGARIEVLPAASRHLIEVMACLGGEVEMTMLQVAAGRSAEEVGFGLLPAAEDGLVVSSRDGVPAAGFRHDRVQQAAYARREAGARAELSLAIARRLAAVPDFALAAAHQYLAAIDRVTDPAERQTAATLLRGAAHAARLVTNHVAAQALLAAAMHLLDHADESYRDVQAEWHAALCSLGLFGEADEVYRALELGEPDPVRHTGTVCEQIVGLTNRGRLAEALTLGLEMLGRLGIEVPTDQLRAEIGAGLTSLYEWLGADESTDLDCPELTDPHLIAVARLINRLIPPAFLSDQTRMAWLVLYAGRMWTEQGTAAALLGPASRVAFVIIPMRGDYRAGYEAVRRMTAVGEARGYEPDASLARFWHALATVSWFEPVENGVRLAREARDGLLRAGDLQSAAGTYYATLPQVLCCAPDLRTVRAETDDALALCDRIGFRHAAASFLAYRRLVDVLHGDAEPTDGFDDDDLDGNPTAKVSHFITRALVAAIFQDVPALISAVSAAMPLLSFIPATYNTATAHVLAVLAAAERARAAAGAEREAALSDLDRSREFLTGRAADQPANFRHLQRLAEAERAAVTGDFAAAAAAYDAAAGDAAMAGQPWHAALTAERAGLFFLHHRLEYAGERHLTEAFRGYAAWGAPGKTGRLERAHPFLAGALAEAADPRLPVQNRSTVNVSTEVIDLLAVLEAARALSSETDLDRLRVRVEQVLSAMTGATQVRLVLLDDATGGWVLPADPISGRPVLTVAQAAEQCLLPLTALRYAERTREPMLVDDTSRDDRVARDPYLAGLDHCSMLVVPVISHGVPAAMLVLENRLTRRAFTTGRLDAVLLVAGQLTVSLENALVYASLERKVAERTEALAGANQQLELLSLTDPLTGLANRRRLTDALESEWLRSLRSGEPIAIAMIDIDNFKKYNDRYGHQGGDECLRLIARTVGASVRTTDLVARYGGEEFCIVMPATNPAGAMVVAERARQSVADLAEPHFLSDYGIVTISVGVAVAIPARGSVPDEVVKVADDALYEAKQSGRNRVAAG